MSTTAYVCVSFCFVVVALQAEDVEAGNGDAEKMLQRLMEVHKEYLSRSRLYDQYYEDYTRCSQEIVLKKQALDAFGEAVAMFEEQMKLHEKFQREAHRHEIHISHFSFPTTIQAKQKLFFFLFSILCF